MKKCYDLLSSKGKIVGLLFNFPLTQKGPPFGGSTKEYINLFNPYFNIETMELCYNSVKERNGKEIFIRLKKNAIKKSPFRILKGLC